MHKIHVYIIYTYYMLCIINNIQMLIKAKYFLFSLLVLTF